MKVFITGATGFIGKHLVKRLTDEGHDITINLFGAEESPFDKNVLTYRLNEFDNKNDTEFLRKEKFDGIIHLASLYLTIHKPEEAIKLIESNVRFGTYLLECASNAEIKWFINTGTFWQNYQNATYSPVNLYAASKQAFESIARYYVETEKIHFCTLRLSDSFGPNDTRPKIFNLWERISKTGEKLEMSPGDQTIDILFVDDICDAFKSLAAYLQTRPFDIPNGAVYAAKADKRYTLKKLAAEFEEVVGCKLNISWGGKSYSKREVMNPWDKGEVIPGWHPKISVREGIKIMYMKEKN